MGNGLPVFFIENSFIGEIWCAYNDDIKIILILRHVARRTPTKKPYVWENGSVDF